MIVGVRIHPRPVKILKKTILDPRDELDHHQHVKDTFLGHIPHISGKLHPFVSLTLPIHKQYLPWWR